MAHTGDLYSDPRVFATGADLDALFLDAMRDTFAFHFARCRPYRDLCRREGFAPGDLRGFPDLFRIPHLFVGSLKERDFRSVPPREVALTLTSSGTGGRRSKIFLCAASIERILRILRAIFADLGLIDPRPVNYLCFTYDPEVAKDLGTAFSDRSLTAFAPAADTAYAIRWSEEAGEFRLDERAVKEALLAFAASGLPVRILGFPSFLWRIVRDLRRETGRDFAFGDRSYVLTGGGWKGEDDRRIDPGRFRAELGGILGIPERNFRDMFGMVEHGIPYMECERHRFHIPVHARARVRDPLTLRDLGFDAPGILHLSTPYCRSTPNLSLLTTDKALLRRDCPCGRAGGTIELLGRGGIAKHKGCAITATELLKKAGR